MRRFPWQILTLALTFAACKTADRKDSGLRETGGTPGESDEMGESNEPTEASNGDLETRARALEQAAKELVATIEADPLVPKVGQDPSYNNARYVLAPHQKLVQGMARGESEAALEQKYATAKKYFETTKTDYANRLAYRAANSYWVCAMRWECLFNGRSGEEKCTFEITGKISDATVEGKWMRAATRDRVVDSGQCDVHNFDRGAFRMGCSQETLTAEQRQQIGFCQGYQSRYPYSYP